MLTVGGCPTVTVLRQTARARRNAGLRRLDISSCFDSVSGPKVMKSLRKFSRLVSHLPLRFNMRRHRQPRSVRTHDRIVWSSCGIQEMLAVVKCYWVSLDLLGILLPLFDEQVLVPMCASAAAYCCRLLHEFESLWCDLHASFVGQVHTAVSAPTGRGPREVLAETLAYSEAKRHTLLYLDVHPLPPPFSPHTPLPLSPPLNPAARPALTRPLSPRSSWVWVDWVHLCALRKVSDCPELDSADLATLRSRLRVRLRLLVVSHALAAVASHALAPSVGRALLRALSPTQPSAAAALCRMRS